LFFRFYLLKLANKFYKMSYANVHITLTLQQVLDFVQQLPPDYQSALLAMLSTQQTNQTLAQAQTEYATLRGTLAVEQYQRNTAQTWEQIEQQVLFTDETDEEINNALNQLS
jgi:hypothetical protein